MTIESAKARTACLVRRHNDNRSMPHNLQIGWCHVGRVAELQRFIDTAWRPDHILARDQGLLRWQYRFPGKPQELSILVAEEAGQIIGMLGAIQVGFSDRGKRHPGVMLALWIVKEEYRERAVGLRLYQRLMDGQCAFIGVLGINEEVARIYPAMRYAMWERIPRWGARLLEGRSCEVVGAARRGVFPTRHRRLAGHSRWCASTVGSWRANRRLPRRQRRRMERCVRDKLRRSARRLARHGLLAMAISGSSSI